MGIKKYLPYENYVLKSPLSAGEIKARLADTISPKTNTWSPRPHNKPGKPYKGQVSGNHFSISRIIQYRNSFLPIITGDIETAGGITQVKIKMKPALFVIIFMSFWLGIVGLFCLGIIVAGCIRFQQVIQHGFSPVILIPFAMFVFGYLLVTLGFKAESKKSKEFLAALLDAQQG